MLGVGGLGGSLRDVQVLPTAPSLRLIFILAQKYLQLGLLVASGCLGSHIILARHSSSPIRDTDVWKAVW